ncbi:MAG TPA: transporter, partial [Firmicutes bacterium]|nr:transporter [Bacillota bacterium]
MKKLANITTNYPRTIIVITLILTVFFGYFAARVTMTTNIKEFFPQDDPRVMTYDRVEAEFGGAEYIMLALEAEDLFTPETIRNIDLITRDLEQIEGVANVRSLTSVDEIKGTEWGLELSPLV